MSDSHAAPSRNPGIEEAPLDDELILYDPTSGRFHRLNPTMAFLWKRCDGTRVLADIARELSRAFSGVDPDSARADLDRALEELRSLGLVA
ncbi:MAG TPA: HPr-rel-A system PqqD family peptide chaperone [Vicinamibacteria bacterium]|nr:HPr-rel-A system PqqD family peptide chaperone [Vicinamibacteria bacterium]